MACSSSAKLLLKRSLQHTEVHNKAWEERHMWKRRHLESSSYSKSLIEPKDRQKRDTGSKSSSGDGRLNEPNADPYYWTRKLNEVKEKDPNKWSHSGYKELYPEEFDATPVIVLSDSEENDIKKHRKKKKEHHRRRKKEKRSKSAAVHE